MNIDIRSAKSTDLPQYTKFLQQCYQDAYPDEKIGLTKACFSEKVFNSPESQKYIIENLKNNDKQKVWLAFDGPKLVGSISILEREHDYVLRGFYVAVTYQNKGIGKKLWNLARAVTTDKDITCDIFAHNKKTIAIYTKWGFILDTVRGEFYSHWSCGQRELMQSPSICGI